MRFRKDLAWLVLLAGLLAGVSRLSQVPPQPSTAREGFTWACRAEPYSYRFRIEPDGNHLANYEAVLSTSTGCSSSRGSLSGEHYRELMRALGQHGLKGAGSKAQGTQMGWSLNYQFEGQRVVKQGGFKDGQDFGSFVDSTIVGAEERKLVQARARSDAPNANAR